MDVYTSGAKGDPLKPWIYDPKHSRAPLLVAVGVLHHGKVVPVPALSGH